MPQQSVHLPQERRPDDTATRTKRDDRIHDRRTHAKHPDDDRLTPADLHRHKHQHQRQHQRERDSTHAQVSRRR